jgi:hypothetical protein
LPPTVSWLLLQALFITVLRDEPSHSPSPAGFAYLEFSWTPAPFLFFSVEPYQPVAIAVLAYLEFTWGSSPPLLSDKALCTSATVGSLPFSKHAGGGGVAPHLPSPAGLFIYRSCGEVPLPLSPVEYASRQPLLEDFPSPSSLGGPPPPPSSAGLFIYNLLGKVPLHHSSAKFATWRSTPPPFSRAQGTPPSLLCVLFFNCLFIILGFFCL